MYDYIEINEMMEPSGKYKIAYIDRGSKKKLKNVIFCVHGILRNCRDFDFIAEKLSKDYRVISIDVVGRGQSSWLFNTVNYNNVFYCRGIMQMMDKLKIKDITWIGSSMGGILGMMVNKASPGRIKKMILNDVGAFVDAEVLANVSKYLVEHYSFESFDDAVSNLKLLLSPFGVKEEEKWKNIIDSSISSVDNGKYIYNYDSAIYNFLRKRIDNPRDANMWNIWNAVEIPTLILRGEYSKFLSKDTLDMMINDNNKKYISTRTISGVGHTPSLMYDDQVKIISDWLKKN